MSAPDIIHELVNRFRDSYDFYTSANYNEAQLRQEFINPFFEALGWDMTNKAGYAPQYREVIHEDSQKQSDGKTKAPDYAFRIGSNRIFFLEAKKPHTKIKIESDPAFQLRRYGWNAHMSLSILTNFDKFAVYDCRTRPNEKDSPATGRVLLLSFEDYLEKWDEIVSIFSKDAVLKGAFDRFAEDKKGKKGTTEVDSEFLKEIEKWRDKLARNIANRNFSRASNNQITNHHQAERNLNYAVQTTIDRILFLRICEDRKIEPENQLLEIANGKDIYANLLILFQKADQKYNSGLFHFSTEKNQTSEPDSFTPSLKIDDEVLRDIIKTTYYPCPYIFNEIPVEILGQVYEQFLGSVIRLTPAGMAKVEEKPEVRKAGGVYYTPRYIVDYIVQNTVCKLLNPEGQTTSNEGGKGPKALSPEQALKIRIVDPACGSGSFLLGAYQFLLDYHLSYYLNHEPKNYLKGKSPALVPTDDGGYSLSLEAKKRILTSCIFGVDIDSQAVEVTKLSLLLKLLEGEKGQLSLGIERILPDLGNNIRCGNSLIGWDYFKDQLFADEEEIYRVNPFNWQAAFPQVFADGGFDAVIGNPPYIRQESLGDDKRYYEAIYKVFTGTADIYSYFIEKGVDLLAPGGQFSYIVANKWLRAKYGFKLRKWLKTKCIEEIIDFGDLPVFTNATTYPLILRVSNNPPHFKPMLTTVDTLDFISLQEYVNQEGEISDQTCFEDDGWSLAGKDTQDLLAKLRENSIPLGEYVHGKTYRGILTGLNKAFVIDQKTKDRLIAEDPKSEELIKPFIIGKDIQRYKINWDNKYIIFTRRGVNINDYPAIQTYLTQFKHELMPKPANWKGDSWKGRKPGPYKWYEIQDTVGYFKEFEKPKIVWGNLAQRPKFTMDTQGFYVNAPSVIIPLEDYYLLGILNSSIGYTFISLTAAGRQGGFFEYKPIYVSQVPIHVVDKNNPKEIAIKNQIEANVKHLLELNGQSPQTPLEKRKNNELIGVVEKTIDQLVFELYNLSNEEIELIIAESQGK